MKASLSEILKREGMAIGSLLGATDKATDEVREQAMKKLGALLKNRPTYTTLGVVRSNFQAGYEDARKCDDGASRSAWNRLLTAYGESNAKFEKPRSASIVRKEKADARRASKDPVFKRKLQAKQDKALQNAEKASKIRELAQGVQAQVSEYKEVALTFNGKRPLRAESAEKTLTAVYEALVSALEERDKLTK